MLYFRNLCDNLDRRKETVMYSAGYMAELRR